MRLKLFILLLAAAVASPTQAQFCSSSSQEAKLVEHAIRSFFVALAKDDRAAFQRIVTADFYAFDGGAKMTGNELFQFIVGAHRAGRVINWTIGRVAAKSDCNLAWASWDNVGSSGVPPKLMPRRWMESAVLRRSPNGWRLEFLHSTSLAPPATK
jgi:ketosteroid isomerase-like protein